ncbi:MAG: hypothetical protein RH860_01515 [Cytophagales bacterium]
MKKLIALVFLSAFLSVQIAPAMAFESNFVKIENEGGDDVKAKKKDKKKAKSKDCAKKDMKDGCCKDVKDSKKEKSDSEK